MADLKLTKNEKSWILYDVANSAFVLIMVTTLGPFYFKEVASKGIDNAISTSNWGFALSASSFVLAVLSPILGSFADYKDAKKKFLLFFLLLGVISTLLLTTVTEGAWFLFIMLFMLGKVGFQGSNVFYDSLLVDVTTEDKMDKVSAHGYGWGYIGSTIPYIICLVTLTMYKKMTGDPSGFPMTVGRIVFVITAIWWAVFSVPLFKNVKQIYSVKTPENPITGAFLRIVNTFKEISGYKQAFIFLLAYFFFIDGVYTVIGMSVAYGYDLGLSATFMAIVVLLIQIVAWPFSILFSNLSRYFGTKKLIYFGITVYIVITILAFMIPSFEDIKSKQILFGIIALMVASSQGGIQALSRSYFGKLVPKDKSAEFFGFYNVVGKFATVLGPLIIGIVTRNTGESKFGILSLVFLFIIGAIFLVFVKKDEITSEE